ncbi:hypothetical protein C5167_023643 [Papaver somniferum]|uniref:MATH domain-containing protein n=1 Tax=Papaver somniferum TaxID=3469 RepID=A0A4Y7JMC3_PAPSO|nr:ubiquitin carboxyl-terminal hydrolase 12-like [Papaver somniferum]RZC61887.1 hypothetical protein C5167_023643 [Papaver somniferum]
MASSVRFIWKIDNFSQLYLTNKEYQCSDVFSAAGAKWKVKIYPMGSGEVFDHLSVYLYREDSANSPVNVKYRLAITSQTNPANTKTVAGEKPFVSSTVAWGYLKFLPLSQLHDSSKGYLVNDTCEIVIEITRQIVADVKKCVKQEGKQPVKREEKHLLQAKPVVKQSNSGDSAITCICFSCVTTHKIAGVSKKPAKLEGKQSVKEDRKQSSRAKSVVKSNSRYSTTSCTWFSCVTRH